MIVPGAKVIAVGTPRQKPANNAQDAQQDPGTVVPVTFALTKKQELRVAHAQVFAADVRLALLRPGDRPERSLAETIFRGEDPKKGDEGITGMSARLLIAVADDETARRAAAQAREAELEVADIVIDPDELHRGLRRLDVDVVLLHDALGGTPVLDLARELVLRVPRGRPDPARRRRLARAAARGDAGRLPRRGRAPARARVLRGQRARGRRSGRARCATASPARSPRAPRSAASSSPSRAPRAASARPRSRCTSGMAAARMAPGPPGLPGRLRPAEGRFPRAAGHAAPAQRGRPRRRRPTRSPCATCRRRCTRTRTASGCCSRPRRARRPRTSTPRVARNVLCAVKARHALTVVDIGAVATEATAIAAELAGQVLVVTTPDVLALRGVRRMRDLWKRLGVREDDDVKVAAQPRVAAARDPARPGAQGRRRDDGPDDDPGRLQRVRGRGQHRLAEPPGGQQAARRVRGAGDRARDRPARPSRRRRRDDEPRGLLARLGGERGQSTAEFMGLFPVIAVVFLALWQIALTGYTYVAAGHAAREGARELATDPTSPKTDEEWREAASATGQGARLPRGRARGPPGAWRKHAEIQLRGDVTVSVRLKVPLLIPGLKSPLTIGSTADTVLEDGELSDRQETTPHKNDYGEDGNWN